MAPEKNWLPFPARFTLPLLSALRTEAAAEMRNLLFGEFKAAGTWGRLEAFVEKLVEFRRESPPRLFERASLGLAILDMFTLEFCGPLTQLLRVGCFRCAPILEARERFYAVWLGST